MRIVSAEEVHGICGWDALVSALHNGHKLPPPLVDNVHVTAQVRGQTQTYINLPAMIPGVAFGSKIITVIPDNVTRHPGTPAIQALYTLFDGDTGSPKAVIDGTALTYRKTAADSALGARLLARDDVETLLLVGAGGLAPWLARAHMAMRPTISSVLVWNRTSERAQAVAEELQVEGVNAQPASDLESAVRAADLVSCCTASTQPLVRGEWIRPGTHIDLVGGFTPQMREVDDDAIRRGRLFVDAQWNIDTCGDYCDPLRRNIIKLDQIEADLYGLCSGAVKCARKLKDITIYKNGGGGHLDLYTALFIVDALQG